MNSEISDLVIIRPAEPRDKYAIVEIQYNALKILGSKDYNSQQLNALLRSKSTPRKFLETIFVAEINRHPVGFASLLHPPNTIGAVFVDPNFARKSIGTQLLQRIEQEAKTQNIPILWVCSSLTGYNFYKANNYQTINKSFLALYSTYIPCVQMKKRLLPVATNEIIKEIYQLFIIAIASILLISFYSFITTLVFGLGK